jgi:hypothetical protein
MTCPYLVSRFVNWRSMTAPRWSWAWEKAGAQLVDDVGPFEIAKLRMLNTTRSTLAYLSMLAGFETTSDGYVSRAPRKTHSCDDDARDRADVECSRVIRSAHVPRRLARTLFESRAETPLRANRDGRQPENAATYSFDHCSMPGFGTVFRAASSTGCGVVRILALTRGQWQALWDQMVRSPTG